MRRKALACKQRDGLIERQTNDAGIGANELDDKGPGEPLDGIAAGLAAPFAGGEIGLHILAGKALEAHPRLHQAVALAALCAPGGGLHVNGQEFLCEILDPGERRRGRGGHPGGAGADRPLARRLPR